MPFSILFQRELPHGLCVGVRLPEPSENAGELALEQLGADERAHAAGLPFRRRITWVGGRVALHRALERAGQQAGAILATERGAPSLPPGIAGSVSHKEGLAVALVAPAAGWRVGIDIERMRVPRAEIERHVLTEGERQELTAFRLEERWREVLLRFSAKEAVYKALDPFVRRYVSFQEVTVRPEPQGGGRVQLALKGGEGPFQVEMGWEIDEQFVLTTARVTPSKGSGG
jgi:phosphopantetheine--protein transferase-like protein